MFLGQPAWSPDGKHIAWVAGPPNGYGTVWVADASGRNARALHQFGQSLLGYDLVDQITWETSRSLLVGAELDQQPLALYRLSLSSRVERIATVPDLGFSTDRSRRLIATNGPNCSPSGDCPSRIYILHLAGGKVTRAGSVGDLDAGPALSPDGKRVAYERTVCRPDCGNSSRTWLAPVSGTGKPREIAPAGEDLTWSPDGRSIAYMLPSGFQDLAIVQPGRKPRILPRSGGNPVFSPDSRLLAYDGVTNGGSWNATIGHLVVLNLHAHRAVLVSPRWLGNINAHSWSPDGRKLIVAARPTDACTSLYTVTVRTKSWKLFRACG